MTNYYERYEEYPIVKTDKILNCCVFIVKKLRKDIIINLK